MKSLLKISMVLIIIKSVNAQPPVMNKGKVISDNKYSYVTSVFGHDETGYYAFSEIKFKPVLEKYDLSFNKLVSVKLELKNDPYKGRDEQRTFFYANTIYVISTSYNDGTKTRMFFSETLDKNTLLSTNNVTKICELPTKDADAFCSVKLSDDKSKLLIIQNTGNEYAAAVINCDKMQQEYIEKFALTLDKLIRYVNSYVTNTGNTILYTHQYEKNASSTEMTNYKGQLYTLTKSGKEKATFPLELQSDKSGDIGVGESNNTLIVAGYLSSAKIENVDGCFFMNIDLSAMKAGEIKTSKFASSYKDLNLDHILILKDGGAILLGEKSNQYHNVNEGKTFAGSPVTYNSPTNPITGQREQAGSKPMRYFETKSESYLHGNILAVNFGKEGTVRWNKEILKRQFFTAPGNYGYSYLMFASYTTILTADKIHLIFNDHINNLPKKEEKLEIDFQRKAPGALIDVAVNLSDGSYSKSAIEKFEFSKGDIIYRPNGALQISPNEIVMFGSNEDNHQGVLIKF